MSRASAVDSPWYGVTWGSNTFVAVAGEWNTNLRIMTSTDSGVTW